MPSYFCTWSAQGYDHPEPLLSEWGRSIDALTEENLFGPRGWARTGVAPAARAGLVLLLDVGWDVSAADYRTRAWHPLGSQIVDTAKFPSCTGTPPERLRRLVALAHDAGWAGLGLWIAPQSPDEGDTAWDHDRLAAHFRERLAWSREAGVAYWKVDCGRHMMDVAVRRLISRLAREEYPALVVEQAWAVGPLNDEPTPWHKQPMPRSARFVHARDDQGRSYAEQTAAVAAFSDVLRTYDVSTQLSVASTLDRVAAVLAATTPEPAARALINCEDEIYQAAALGLCFGVMRHPSWRLGPGLDYDPFLTRHRMDEVTRAVAWQRLAPPFPIEPGATLRDDALHTDAHVFADGHGWINWTGAETILQSCPARVARGGLPLPGVALREHFAPTLVASRHPNGAVALATLPRTRPDRGVWIPEADLTITAPAPGCPLAFFGRCASLRITFAGPAPARVFARDLAGGPEIELSADATREPGALVLPGPALTRAGLAAASPDDPSDPGLVLTFA